MGLDPNMWGPAAWHFIHAVALEFPNNPSDAKKLHYATFFNNLPHILPCQLCGVHLSENLRKMPPPLDSPKGMFQWTADLHNKVNRQIGKPEIDYLQAYAEFKKNAGVKVAKRRLFGRVR